MLAVSASLLWQLTADGVVTAAFYTVMSIGFGLIMGVTGRFHFAYGIGYVLGGFVVAMATEDWGWGLAPAALLGMVVVMLFGVVVEAFLYRPLERRNPNQALLAIFITALGLGIAGENILKLVWGPTDRTLRSIPITTQSFGSVTLQRFDFGQLITAVVVVAVTTMVLRYSDIGRRVLAVKVNPGLAETMGMNTRAVFLGVFAIGSALSVAAGVWRYAKFTVSAGMGFAPTLTAFVIVFLVGLEIRPIAIAGWSLVIALAERYTTIWFAPTWGRLVVLAGLLGYLLYQSGRQSGFFVGRGRARSRPAVASGAG